MFVITKMHEAAFYQTYVRGKKVPSALFIEDLHTYYLYVGSKSTAKLVIVTVVITNM
jgi:hypothetical protein